MALLDMCTASADVRALLVRDLGLCDVLCDRLRQSTNADLLYWSLLLVRMQAHPKLLVCTRHLIPFIDFFFCTQTDASYSAPPIDSPAVH